MIPYKYVCMYLRSYLRVFPSGHHQVVILFQDGTVGGWVGKPHITIWRLETRDQANVMHTAHIISFCNKIQHALPAAVNLIVNTPIVEHSPLNFHTGIWILISIFVYVQYGSVQLPNQIRRQYRSVPQRLHSALRSLFLSSSPVLVHCMLLVKVDVPVPGTLSAFADNQQSTLNTTCMTVKHHCID